MRMLLAYLDESYTAAFYFIAALVCPEDVANPLTKALDDVVRKAARAYPGKLTTDAELHGHPLFHGRDDWSEMAPLVRARIGVYDDALSAIGAHDVQIVLRGLDIERLRQRYTWPDPPASVVLQHTLERVNGLASRAQTYGLVVADEVHNQQEHRVQFGYYRRHGTPGYLSSTLPQLVDTIHFAPSHASRLLQAADLIAFLHRRRQTHTETDQRAQRANDLLWSRVAPRIIHEHTWLP
jgi:hypothetical protein